MNNPFYEISSKFSNELVEVSNSITSQIKETSYTNEAKDVVVDQALDVNRTAQEISELIIKFNNQVDDFKKLHNQYKK